MRKTVGVQSSYSGSSWLMIAPAIVLLSFFVVIPAGLGLLSTFTNYSPQQANWKIVGLLNYQQVMEDHTLGSAFTNGIILTALTVPLEIGLALLVTALLRRPFPGRSYLRVVLLLPWLVGPMAA